MKWTLLVLAALFPFSCLADNGNNLYNRLNSTDSVDRIEAISYIAGVADAETLRTEMEDFSDKPKRSRSHLLCIPDGVTRGQLMDVVKAYLTANPARRHWESAALTRIALASVWQCQK